MNLKHSINIKKISHDEYQKLIFNDEFSYLQSWDYGEIKSNLEKVNVYRYIIYDTNNILIGYFQLLAIEYFNLIIYAKINRGPVLFCNTFSEYELLKIIKKYFFRKFVLIFDIAPNTNYSKPELFYKLGYFKKSVTPWGTSIINLLNSSDLLFKKLDPKWRNAMLKSEKNNIKFLHCNFKDEINELKKMYEELQKKNNFTGLSTKFLDYISNKNNFNELDFDVYSACIDNSETRIGYIIIINNLNTSTYLLGVSNDIGRKYNVNSFLLWKSIIESKNNGKKYYDTGGMNADTPLGIYKFKDGLNGEKISLIGEFRQIFLISNFISLIYNVIQK